MGSRRIRMVLTVILLIGSNCFMTYAWYGHLKQRAWPMATAIALSWLIALPEYCLQVPANRLGYGTLTAFQLKIMQEVITLGVFVVFAWIYLGEKMRWNYAISMFCVFLAVLFAFWRPAPSKTARQVRPAMQAAPEASDP